MKKIILFYGRKSEEDSDRQIYSLEKQEDLSKTWERRNEIQITERFEEERSAFKKIKRPEFQKMIALAKRELKKGHKVTIISWKINRLTRNPRDNFVIEELLDKGCEFDFFEEPFSNDPAGRLVFRIFLSMAVHYSENLSSDVRGGQKTAISRGMYPGNAVIGYHKKEEQHIPRKAIKEEAWKIKECFERISDGEGVQNVRKWALDVAKIKSTRSANGIRKDAFYRMITNPFYCGWFEWNNVLYKNGKHEKIISPALYLRVQSILKNKKRKISNSHHYLFSNLVYENGILLHGTTNKNCHYYRNPETGKHYREDFIEKKFIELLQKNNIEDYVISEFKKSVKKILGIKNEENTTKEKLFDAEIGKLKNKLSKIQEKVLDEEISASDYSDFKKIIESKIIQLGSEKTEKNIEGMSDNSNIVEKALELLKTAKQKYGTLSRQKKAQFINSVLLELSVADENALFKTKKGAQALLELPLLPIGSP